MERKIKIRGLIAIILVFIFTISSWQIDSVKAATNEYDVKEETYVGDGYEVTFCIKSQWSDAFNADVTIKNTSEKTIDNWTIGFDMPYEITNIWNSDVKSKENDHYIVKNSAYNQDILAGQSISFGFTANGEGSILIPTSYELLCSDEIVEDKNTEVTFNVIENWESGFNGELTITNNTDKTIEDWKLEFDLDCEINSFWTAEILSHEGTHYIVKNAGYNSNIEPHQTINLGFNSNAGDVEKGIQNVKVTQIVSKENSHSNIEQVYIKEKNIFSSEPINNLFNVKVNKADINDEYKVKLFIKRDNSWEIACELFDNGDLNSNCDEIKNDSIFSNSLLMNENNVGIIELKFLLYNNDIEADSYCTSIEVLEPVSDEEIIKIDNNLKNIEIWVNDYIKNNSDIKIKIEDIVEQIKLASELNEGINSIIKVNDSTIQIVYNNSFISFIQLCDNSDMEVMKRGESTDGFTTQINEKSDYDPSNGYIYVNSKNILLYAPFDTEWGEDDEKEIVKEVAEEIRCQEQLTILSDSNANIDSLKTFGDYGIVIISTHGNNGEWFLTGEKVISSSKYKYERQKGQIATQTNINIKSGEISTYYTVNASYIESLDITLPNSIIINNSCESSKNKNLWKAFQSKGAKAYYGYSGAVTNNYVVFQTCDLLNNLLINRRTTGNSYQYSFDTYYGGQMMILSGVKNVKITSDLVNGDFEQGFQGWIKDGDGRVISQLGDIKPTSGNKMGIISTGLGYTLEKGSIKQSIKIPESAKEIYFDWNFLSEEFLEYIGSRYDDPFNVLVTLRDDNNNVIKLLELNVNKIASQFGATRNNGGRLISISPKVVFDIGDVWMTDWQTEKMDISQYAGQNIDLEFSVRDAVDTIYTTAVLIDNIHFDVTSQISGNEVMVDDYYSESTIRSTYENHDGVSYIFYTLEDSENGKGGFVDHAKNLQKTVKYLFGYDNVEQTIMIPISTEDEFVKEWTNMKGDKDGKIDSVNLIFHGNFYAIIIDADNGENLTVSPDGMVGTDDKATTIMSLPKKQIYYLNISSCNTGLIDAFGATQIRTYSSEEDKDKKIPYTVYSNVAHAFMRCQDIELLSAWDGSVKFTKTGRGILSYKQESFSRWLSELKDVRVNKPKRAKASLVEALLSDGIGFLDPLPFGPVVYYKENEDGKEFIVAGWNIVAAALMP